MEGQKDRAGVIFPPPALALLALIAALALDRFLPLAVRPRAAGVALGTLFSLFGVGIAAWGRVMLVRGRTNVNPYKPTTAIISGGPYRFTRNPLYVGLLSLLAGLSLLVGTWWGVVLLAPTFLILHYGVARREEAYLERKFGQEYLSCQSRVRRWL
jgi:protein-S-isoprenylcysteine O-methyltransferase Ste14